MTPSAMDLFLFLFLSAQKDLVSKESIKDHCLQKMQSSGVLRKKGCRDRGTASKALTLQA